MMTGIPDVLEQQLLNGFYGKPVLSFSSVNIIQNLIQSSGVRLGQTVTDGLNTHQTNRETAEQCRSSCSHQAHSFRLALFDCDREQPKSSWMLMLSLLACTVGLVVSMIKITSDRSRGGCKSNTMEITCAYRLAGGPRGQKCDIHLTSHSGPTFLCDYQASPLLHLHSHLHN